MHLALLGHLAELEHDEALPLPIGEQQREASCPVDDEVLEVLEAAVAALRDAGAEMEDSPGSADLAESAELFQRLCQREGAGLLGPGALDAGLWIVHLTGIWGHGPRAVMSAKLSRSSPIDGLVSKNP